MATGFYREIRIDHTQVGGSDLTDYVLVFSGTYDWLRSIDYGGKVATEHGTDIYFKSADGTELLAFEMVYNSYAEDPEDGEWNPATGFVEFWVKVPVVSHTEDTIIRIYYGDAAQTVDLSDKDATWVAQYKLVAHMRGAYTAFDSSGNGASASPSAMVPTADGDKLGQGIHKTGGHYVLLEIPLEAPLQPADKLTLALWHKPDATCDSYGYIAGTTLKAGAPWLSYGLLHVDTDVTRVKFTVGKEDATNIEADSGAGALTAGEWNHIVGTYNNATGVAKIYVNGALMATSSAGSTGAIDYDTGEALGIGGRPSSIGNMAPGDYDELQILEEVQSADWVLASYNNQLDPDSFYTVGGESGPVSPLACRYYGRH